MKTEKISIDQKVVSIEALINRITRKSIRILPGERWDATQKSKLMESLMLKIPIPIFYVAADVEGNWIVMDGSRRLDVIHDFVLGDFVLEDSTFFPEHSGKTFSELPDPITNRILETELRFAVVNPSAPYSVRERIFDFTR